MVEVVCREVAAVRHLEHLELRGTVGVGNEVAQPAAARVDVAGVALADGEATQVWQAVDGLVQGVSVAGSGSGPSEDQSTCPSVVNVGQSRRSVHETGARKSSVLSRRSCRYVRTNVSSTMQVARMLPYLAGSTWQSSSHSSTSWERRGWLLPGPQRPVARCRRPRERYLRLGAATTRSRMKSPRRG